MPIHPEIGKTRLLSDHIKQIADICINDTTLRIVTHNMLKKCRAKNSDNTYTNTNNAWNIDESEEQYWDRLTSLAKDYNQDIAKGASIIALQEAPGDADRFFKLMNLDASWHYESRSTGKAQDQKLMLIYNAHIIEIKEVLEVLDQKGNLYKSNIKELGLEVNLINVHIPYGESSYQKLGKTKDSLVAIMNTDPGISIRFGDHNANTSRFKDLKVWQNTMPTSFAYDKEDPETGKAIFSFIDKRDERLGIPEPYKNYDGFAFSKNFENNESYSYVLRESQVIIPTGDTNTNFIITELPEVPVLGNIADTI
jgi:hypothetical protein